MDSNKAHPRMVLRLGTAGLLGLALFGAAVAMHDGDGPEPIHVSPAVVLADPLAAELTRCRKLGSEAAGNPACEEAWAKNRAKFFSSPGTSLEH